MGIEPTGALQKLYQKAALIRKNDPALSPEQSFAEAMKQNPSLYSEYRPEWLAKIQLQLGAGWRLTPVPFSRGGALDVSGCRRGAFSIKLTGVNLMSAYSPKRTLDDSLL